MIEVLRIPIDVRVPKDEARFVTMQPYVVFPATGVEPFQWLASARKQQLEGIRRTLEVAKDSFDGHGPNFTLFPEYSLPGIKGAKLVDAVVASTEWASDSVVVGGVDGMNKVEYETLCNELSLEYSSYNSPQSVPPGKWVNCCIIWVKNSNGDIQKWVQPKVNPAWAERSGVCCNDMFSGKTIYVFEARYTPDDYPCRFVTFTCYDWVASTAGVNVCDEVLRKLSVGLTDPIPLHWAFVIQHNPDPNHSSFLNRSYRFLTNTSSFPFVERDNAVIIHANTAVAARPSPLGNGAFSACIFSPNAQVDCRSCRPTVRTLPKWSKRKATLQRCHDAVFREMGECIHVFSARVPKFIIPDARDRTYPLPNAYVYATSTTTDPRIPNGAVPATVKWMNDHLDELVLPATTVLHDCPLAAQAVTTTTTVVDTLRSNDGRAAGEVINWASCSSRNGISCRDALRQSNADFWDEMEVNALKHVVYSLTAVGLAYSLKLDGDVPHCYIETEKGLVRVVAVRGATHQDCRVHLDSIISENATDPVLLISQDDEALVPTPQELMKLGEIAGEGGFAFHDYNTLKETCRNAANSKDVKESLDDILPGERRII